MPNILRAIREKVGKSFSVGENIVQAGENLVIGKPPGRTNSVSSHHSDGSNGSMLALGMKSLTKRTISRGSSGGGKQNAKDFTPPENVHVFCSSLYSCDFVKDGLKAVESDKTICSLELEDLVQRNDPEITNAVVEMLVKNALESKIKRHGRNSTKRNWAQIVFVDCISDSNSYKEYLKLKTEFNNLLKERLVLVRKDLPIRFEAKVELHTMLDVMGVIHCLKTVERDQSVKQVVFHGFRGKEKDIPEMFASMADNETMEWKKTTEILLRLRGRPKDFKGNPNPATEIVRKCIQSLEEVVFGSSDISMDFHQSELGGGTEHQKQQRKANFNRSHLTENGDSATSTEVLTFESDSEGNQGV